MIKINNKANCCGCFACYNKCPRSCIKMISDDEGFLYPHVDSQQCIECGLCESVCPILNACNKPLIRETYATNNPDKEERLQSSSGGVFSLLARQILNSGGYVYGTSFSKDWMVNHIGIDSIAQLNKLRGSKYVQSEIGDCYKQIKLCLKSNKSVLFSGTPCEAAGLRTFLGKEYDNLYLVEIVCHGVPSPQVWKDYISSYKDRITRINMRDKRHGWDHYGISIQLNNPSCRIFEQKDRNDYLLGMISNLYLRPSCHECHFKLNNTASDLTIGDFWGIENVLPEHNDNTGMSLVIANTEKGLSLLRDIECELTPVIFDEVVKGNPCFLYSTEPSECRRDFWNDYHKYGFKAVSKFVKHKKNSPFNIIIRKIRNRFLRLLR